MNGWLLDPLPISGVYIGIALSILLSFEIGYHIGKLTRTLYDKEAPVALGPMVGGILGMLAFVLAFVFSMAASHHDLRKQYVLDEANAIGTAYLRADLVDKQHGDETKRLLREYVDTRLQAATSKNLDVEISKSIELHGLLWTQVSSAAETSPNTNTSLLIQSINDVIDMHEKRVTVSLHNRIPGSIWITLFVISALTMITMGTQAGLTGKRRLVAVLPLALAFAALTTIVVDLDRPQKSLIKVGQHALISLKNSMDHGPK